MENVRKAGMRNSWQREEIESNELRAETIVYILFIQLKPVFCSLDCLQDESFHC